MSLPLLPLPFRIRGKLLLANLNINTIMSSDDEADWANALLPPLTDRPVDLTLTQNTHLAAPRQYVWVARAGSRDPAMPADDSLVDEVEPMSTGHEVILRCDNLRIRPLRRPSGVPVPYLRWDLHPEAENQLSFWRLLGLSDEVMKRFFIPTQIDRTLRALQPVFVEAHNGEPFGRWMFHLTRRKNRALALFVQAFGER